MFYIKVSVYIVELIIIREWFILANNNDKIKIDPTEFAKLVLQGSNQQPDEADVKYIKRQLRLYLESLVLIDNFNDLEESRFEIAKETQRAKILQKIIERRY